MSIEKPELVMLGLSVLQACLSGNVQEMANTLTGMNDDCLLAAMLSTARSRASSPEEAAKLTLESYEVSYPLTRLKDMIRDAFRAAIAKGSAAEEAHRKAAHEALLAELKMRNRPSAMGTVAELAAKYGVSKSEIRRHKAAGTLEQALHALEASRQS